MQEVESVQVIPVEAPAQVFLMAKSSDLQVGDPDTHTLSHIGPVIDEAFNRADAFNVPPNSDSEWFIPYKLTIELWGLGSYTLDLFVAEQPGHLNSAGRHT